MKYNKSKKELLAEAVNIDQIDEKTKSTIRKAIEHQEVSSCVDFNTYNIQTCSSLNKIVEYRRRILNRNNRKFHGADDAILKLVALPADHPVSWIALQIHDAIIVLIVDRSSNRLIHAMSTDAPTRP